MTTTPRDGSADGAVQAAVSLMEDFANRTGLTSERPQQRYLWTDSFGVCMYLGLARSTRQERYLELAIQLVGRVHDVLGKFRADDPRKGWISGLEGLEGEDHPTRGGLRIGKRLPERGPLDPFDPELEWERDGQYFHYLTKWMHALDQVSTATRDPRYNLWARELAAAAHASFVRSSSGTPRMAWKMSTDLSRPLVPTMGQHDPLDGLITCLQLEITAAMVDGPPAPGLEPAIADFARMLEGMDLRTHDPLGVGGLLSDAYRLVRILERSSLPHEGLLRSLLVAGEQGVALCERREDWMMPARHRLAFRELGLAIGLSAVDRMEARSHGPDVRAEIAGKVRGEIEALARHRPFGRTILSFWLEPENRSQGVWSEHRDINEVMLATALCPDGFLTVLQTEAP